MTPAQALLVALGACGLARAVYCAWQMQGDTAHPLRRLSNAAMAGGSALVMYSAWASAMGRH